MHYVISHPNQSDVDRVTQKLFYPFRREVGTPRRTPIYNWEQFKSFIEKNNGINDCYAAVYPFDDNVDEVTRLDRIMFDFDTSLPEIGVALESAKVMYNLLVSYGIPVVSIATGNKGLQLHALFEPQTFDNTREVLWLTTYSLIKEAYKGNNRLLSALDVHPVGDVRRICRIPNTLRPPANVFSSSYLPPELNMVTTKDIYEHMFQPRVYEYDFTKRRVKLSDIDLVDAHCDLIPTGDTYTPTYVPKRAFEPVVQEMTLDMLKHIIRPCLFRNLQLGEPPHAVRVAATVDLINMGLHPTSIAKLYSKFGWVDFDLNKTLYQISTIYDSRRNCSRIITYSCGKLRRLKIPKLCCVG